MNGQLSVFEMGIMITLGAIVAPGMRLPDRGHGTLPGVQGPQGVIATLHIDIRGDQFQETVRSFSCKNADRIHASQRRQDPRPILLPIDRGGRGP